jgi:nucleoside-diphosphate-sugar epimerase
MAATAKVLVTGGSGFLGSWCVKVCLDRGYTVHTTVRSAEKAAFLKKLRGADDRLKVFDGVDLMAPGAFDAPTEGCETVLHTASPFFHDGETEEALVPPAVEGTRTVLQSCTKAGVKTVVLTSSIAAMLLHTCPSGTVLTSDIWSDEAKCRETNNWYCLSKTLAEKLAWEMSKEEGCPWKLAVMNPCLILGPMLPGQPSLNTSSNVLVKFFDGSLGQKCTDTCIDMVDVRDVAEAHIAAIGNEKAMGQRFLLWADAPRRIEVAGMIRGLVPEGMAANVPTEVEPRESPGQPIPTDCSPARDILAISFKVAAEMVPDTAKQLLENGYTSVSQYQHKVG